MDIKDKFLRFYIQNFIINNSQNIENPGFIFFKISGKTPIFARQIIMPESFFVNLEQKVAATKKDALRKRLYSAGKKFGFSFSILGGFSKASEKSVKELPGYINIINKFIEGTYAAKISCEVDAEKQICRYESRKFCCNK